MQPTSIATKIVHVRLIPTRDKVYSIHGVIQFFSELRQFDGISWIPPLSQ